MGLQCFPYIKKNYAKGTNLLTAAELWPLILAFLLKIHPRQQFHPCLVMVNGLFTITKPDPAHLLLSYLQAVTVLAVLYIIQLPLQWESHPVDRLLFHRRGLQLLAVVYIILPGGALQLAPASRSQ